MQQASTEIVLVVIKNSFSFLPTVQIPWEVVLKIVQNSYLHLTPSNLVSFLRKVMVKFRRAWCILVLSRLFGSVIEKHLNSLFFFCESLILYFQRLLRNVMTAILQ